MHSTNNCYKRSLHRRVSLFTKVSVFLNKNNPSPEQLVEAVHDSLTATLGSAAPSKTAIKHRIDQNIQSKVFEDWSGQLHVQVNSEVVNTFLAESEYVRLILWLQSDLTNAA